MSKLIRRKANSLHAALSDKSPGQIILLLALAMIGLLVAGGIAVDTGIMFLRRAQLARSVDAAALAGVVDLYKYGDASDGLEAANNRGTQLLGANGITLSAAPVECDSVDWTTDEYCGTRSEGKVPGSVEYEVVARWNAETYFMHLVGFDSFPLWASAKAQYLPLVDIYASDTSEYGYVRASNQSVFGPGSCPNFGDPYSTDTPTDGDWTYTYRVRIPESYITDWAANGFAGDPAVRLDILDPDTGSPNVNTATVFNPLNDQAYPNINGTSNDRKDASLINLNTNGSIGPNVPLTDRMPFWFIRIDENRRDTGCSEPGSYTGDVNTRTVYRLYYYRELPDGTTEEVDLATYIGKADSDNGGLSFNNTTVPNADYTVGGEEARATDLMWVSPGAPAAERQPGYTGGADQGPVITDGIYDLTSAAEPPTYTESCTGFQTANPDWAAPAGNCAGDGDFIVYLNGSSDEVPDIVVQEGSNIRDLYLDIRSVAGGSENGFELWAGPPRSADAGDYLFTAPANVNARQYYMRQQHQLGNSNLHSSYGVGVYGIGHLPMNSNIPARVELPLAYVGPQFAGQLFTIRVFDPDGTFNPSRGPTVFYLDTVSTRDWTACFDGSSVAAGNSTDCEDWGADRTHHRYNPGATDPIYTYWFAKRNASAWNVYSFYIPSEGNTDAINDVPFYGGRLFVSYAGDSNDTIVWDLIVDARPVLIQ